MSPASGCAVADDDDDAKADNRLDDLELDVDCDISGNDVFGARRMLVEGRVWLRFENVQGRTPGAKLVTK